MEVGSAELARSHIGRTKELVSGIVADDDKLDDIKRIGLGADRYCELPGRRYLSEYLVPNFYFHITTAYAILRGLGVPLGKADYLDFLANDVKLESHA